MNGRLFTSVWMFSAMCCLNPLLSAADPPAPSAARLDEAREILRETPLIDGHGDLLWRYRVKSNRFEAIDLAADTRTLQPPMATDLRRLRAGGAGGQFWAVYLPMTDDGHEMTCAALEQLDLLQRLCRRHPKDLAPADTAEDVLRLHREGKIALLAAIEGGHILNNSTAHLRIFRRLGVRYVTLNHVRSLDWADSSADAPKCGGLSPLGEQIIAEMNRIGVIPDLSHSSDDTARAVLKVSKAPVMFSHSGARAVCNHPRNTPDDILRLLAANGGIAMVNFMPLYLKDAQRDHFAARDEEAKRLKERFGGDKAAADAALAEWKAAHPPPPPPSWRDVADHLDHFRRVMGPDHVGIGSDFEGFSGVTTGLEDVSCYPVLLAELLQRGWSREEVKKAAGLNMLRVLRETDAVAARLQP